MIRKPVRLLSDCQKNFVFWVNFTLKFLTEFCQFHPKHSRTNFEDKNGGQRCNEKRNLAS